MCGRISRWLRLLGYDVLYAKNIKDEDLINILITDNRILLTRDRELHQKAKKISLNSILIEKNNYIESLAHLSVMFNIDLEIDPEKSRCPSCNSEIKKRKRESVLGKVPKKVVVTQNDFWQCENPECGKIYWLGSHYKSMVKVLRLIKDIHA